MKVQKSHFLKGDNPCFRLKNANYLVYLDLVKIRLEIMLNDFAEKKRNLSLAIKNRIFQSPKKRTFSKGLTPAFGQKMPGF